MPLKKWTIEQLKDAVIKSKNYREVLNFLNLTANSSYKTIQNYIKNLQIDTSHFEKREDFYKRILKDVIKKEKSLDEILVENSTYNRTHLKRRLYKSGIKKRFCELCGQGEIWKGKRMSLIIDHINGINNDNRLINLRIVCPNCAATLETHCGKNNRKICPICGNWLKYGNEKYCSSECYTVAKNNSIINKLKCRKVERPTYSDLKKDIENLGFLGTGKKYGVSDNAIRKWVIFYDKHEKLNLGV